MRRVLLLVAGCATALACRLEPLTDPPLAGPAELGLALRVLAVPDVLPRDGVSTSDVRVEARDASGRAFQALTLRAEIAVEGVLADVGHLSSKLAVTGNDGRAQFTYTAPPGPFSGNTDAGLVVTIRVTPIGTDYTATLPRSVGIRLVPLGQLLPPAGTPLATFTVSPRTPREGETVYFDASASRDCPPAARESADCFSSDTLRAFAWVFGDGDAGSGVQTSHRYRRRGEYVVSLTVTNDRGRSAIATATVAVQPREMAR